MLFDELMPRFHCLVVCDAGWFLCCAWAISSQDFVGALLGSGVGPLVVYEGHDGEPRFPVILSC